MSNTLTLTRKGTVKVDGLSVKAPRKNAKPRNGRIHLVGAAGAARVHIYTPDALPEGTVITVKVKDAAEKALDHGENRYSWNDEDANVFIKAFIPLAERGTVRKFRITV